MVHHTRGTVTAVECPYQSAKRCTAVVSYTVRGKEYTLKEKFNRHGIDKVRVDKPVDVYYAIELPTRASLQKESNRGIIFIVAGIVALGSSVGGSIALGLLVNTIQ